MSEKSKSEMNAGEEQSVVGLGFCGPGAGANTSLAYVKDGKLVRLRPLSLVSKF